jgi:hypothetical protein
MTEGWLDRGDDAGFWRGDRILVPLFSLQNEEQMRDSPTLRESKSRLRTPEGCMWVYKELP